MLPGVLSKSNWFYKANKKMIDPHLGKPYVSYSTVSSWEEYREDFIKEKLAGIKLPDTAYTAMGSWLGSAVETGFFPEENPYGFLGQENFGLIPRPKKAKYERMILIDRGQYVIIGFIDIFEEVSKGLVNVTDLKTGGKKKEDSYKKPEYIQVVLYAKALEIEGYKINDTGIWFVRREGSHVNPPMSISSEQFYIPLEYSPERVEYALNKVDRVVEEISEIYQIFQKYFA